MEHNKNERHVARLLLSVLLALALCCAVVVGILAALDRVPAFAPQKRAIASASSSNGSPEKPLQQSLHGFAIDIADEQAMLAQASSEQAAREASEKEAAAKEAAKKEAASREAAQKAAQAAQKKAEPTIIPSSSKRLLTEQVYQSALAKSPSLPAGFRFAQMAINEIYARHGYQFEGATLLAYFKKTSWYHPSFTDKAMLANRLSRIESANVDFLVRHR